MGDLSKHFSRSEFACRCGCGQDTVDAVLITVLEHIRAHFGKPITVHSGNRCVAYNRRVGGASSSQHIISRAADIDVRGVSPAEVFAYVDTWHTGGLGSYPTFTHVDSRAERARWAG